MLLGKSNPIDLTHYLFLSAHQYGLFISLYHCVLVNVSCFPSLSVLSHFQRNNDSCAVFVAMSQFISLCVESAERLAAV